MFSTPPKRTELIFLKLRFFHLYNKKRLQTKRPKHLCNTAFSFLSSCFFFIASITRFSALCEIISNHHHEARTSLLPNFRERRRKCKDSTLRYYCCNFLVFPPNFFHDFNRPQGGGRLARSRSQLYPNLGPSIPIPGAVSCR